MPIQYVVGDATKPQGPGLKVICHCVNDVGNWGAGFSGALRCWPHVEKSYHAWYQAKRSSPVVALNPEPSEVITGFCLGNVQFVEVARDLWVANLIGQHRTTSHGERVPIRYDALDLGFKAVAIFCKNRRASVHMPRLGAGLARGRWEEIAPIIETTLVFQGVSVTVYDLPG